VRVGLLKTVQFPDELSNRFQINVKDAIDKLAADHDLLSVPVTSLSATGPIAAGKSVVVYRGNPGAVLSLPPASAQGPSTSAIVLVGNASNSAVTLRATVKDTINGKASISQAAGTVTLLVNDGVSKWWAVIGLVDGDKGDVIVSGDGQTWTIDPDVIAAIIAAVLAALPTSASSAGVDGTIGRRTVNVFGEVLSSDPLEALDADDLILAGESWSQLE
jgi:hypothetical protein